MTDLRTFILAIGALCLSLGPASAQQEEMVMTQPAPVMGPIVQIALPTNDLARSVAFYRDTLGLPLLFEVSGMAFFDVHGTRLLIGAPDEPENIPNNSAVYFDTADMNGTAAALEAKGVTFLGAPEVVQRTDAGELRLHFFRDPDGNLLALMGLVAMD